MSSHRARNCRGVASAATRQRHRPACFGSLVAQVGRTGSWADHQAEYRWRGGTIIKVSGNANRTSTTVPTSCEPASRTVQPSSSLSCMSTPRNVRDHVVAKPVLDPQCIECHIGWV